mgnify:CR=1 FL=1
MAEILGLSFKAQQREKRKDIAETCVKNGTDTQQTNRRDK